MNKKKFIIVATVPMMIFFFLRNHITNLVNNYQVTILTNTKDFDQLNKFLPKEVIIKDIPFQRKINIVKDFISFLLLLKFFYTNKIDIVYSISPKTGLLSMFAGKIFFVPIRINNFTGQQWVIKKGIKKFIIKNLDKLTARLATINLVDGNSQRNFLIKNNIVSKNNSKVILEGSICGIDLNRFYPNKENGIIIRNKLNIPTKDTVFIYLGRVNKNKGIHKISHCLISMIKQKINITFLVVGPEEDKTIEEVKKIFKDYENNLKIVPFTHSPENYLQASDVFCTLSNKEGFGNSVIEAGACGLPSIGSNIYGLKDSIIHDKTGFLVNRDDKKEIEFYFRKFATDYSLINKMGENAKTRALKFFDQDIITKEFINILNELQK